MSEASEPQASTPANPGPPESAAAPTAAPASAPAAAPPTAAPPALLPPALATIHPRLWAFLGLLFLVPFPSIAIIDGWYDGWHTVGRVIFAFSKFWILLIPLAWLFLIEKRRPSWSPPRRGGFIPALGIGLGSALLILSGFVLVRPWINLAAVHEVATREHLTSPLELALGAAYWCGVNSLLEEYVWRWFVVEKLEVLLSPRGTPAPAGDLPRRWTPSATWACILAAAFFMTHHAVALSLYVIWPLALLGSLGVFVGGLSWSWLYRRYGSIWPGYLAHILADLAIFIGIWPLIVR